MMLGGAKLSSYMERSDNMHSRRQAKLMSEPASHMLSTRMNICATELAGSTVFTDVTVASLLCAPAKTRWILKQAWHCC